MQKVSKTIILTIILVLLGTFSFALESEETLNVFECDSNWLVFPNKPLMEIAKSKECSREVQEKMLEENLSNDTELIQKIKWAFFWKSFIPQRIIIKKNKHIKIEGGKFVVEPEFLPTKIIPAKILIFLPLSVLFCGIFSGMVIYLRAFTVPQIFLFIFGQTLTFSIICFLLKVFVVGEISLILVILLNIAVFIAFYVEGVSDPKSLKEGFSPLCMQVLSFVSHTVVFLFFFIGVEQNSIIDMKDAGYMAFLFLMGLIISAFVFNKKRKAVILVKRQREKESRLRTEAWVKKCSR